MTVIFSKIVALTRHYPVVRGMISYGMIWPTSCIIQQTIAGKTLENYDWMQALRYSLYGCFITAPTLYTWIRISSVLWPGTNLKTSITKVFSFNKLGSYHIMKLVFTQTLTLVLVTSVIRNLPINMAIVEQFTYGPVALASFFFGMTLLEGKGITEAKNAIETKMFSTWKVGACVWPVVQTINFCYIPEKNRVPFVSVCSLVWCCFLAYMHQLEIEHKELELTKSLKN